MLLVYNPDSERCVVPEGGGIINRNILTGRYYSWFIPCVATVCSRWVCQEARTGSITSLECTFITFLWFITFLRFLWYILTVLILMVFFITWTLMFRCNLPPLPAVVSFASLLPIVNPLLAFSTVTYSTILIYFVAIPPCWGKDVLGVVKKRSFFNVCNYFEQQSKKQKVATPLKYNKKTAETTSFARRTVDKN